MDYKVPPSCQRTVKYTARIQSYTLNIGQWREYYITGLNFKINNVLTFAKLFAQCELVPLYQDLLKIGQQPAAQPFQQLGHAHH